MTLKEVIAMTHAYYNRSGVPLLDQVLLMYAEDLSDLPEAECIDAYNRYRRDPNNKTFPLPAHIRELVQPEKFISPEVSARETAQRIVGAITKFGWNNARDAQEFIGPEGWGVVDRCGGWSHLCQNMGGSINPTAFQAQVRDQLEGVFKYGLPSIEAKLKITPKKISGELVQANFARLLGEKPEGEE